MDELQQAVAKLRSLSPRLNSAVEQAQRVVLQVEHFLVHECQLAVQAEVPVSYNDKGVAVMLMRYGRVNGKFHIGLTHTDGDARFVNRAWVDCDRSEKLTSFPALPKLLMAITKSVESQIAATSSTSQTVSNLMSALDAVGSDPSKMIEEPQLSLLMRPEEALAAQVGARPAQRAHPALPKANPDQGARRVIRKDEAKVG
jgi:hypothetical protein